MAGPGDGADVPTVSGPSADDARGPQQTPPQIEGYEVRGFLGEGGMGTVWRAVQLSTRRPVALKLLRAGGFASAKARLRFEREVELAARLEHPHIARVYESGLYQGVYYYAMELVEGVHLDQYAAEHALPQRQVLALMRTVCEAVQHAHQRGVIHRDLKPSNIMVTPDGQPHVLDFGLAKTLLEEDAHLAVSMDGDVAGTPAYMSPEQAAAKLNLIDTRTDVYSLGVILYRLLTNEFPHDLTGTRLEVLRRIAEEEVRRPRQFSKAVDKELEALLLKALAHDPEGRYPTAQALAEDIRNYLTGEPLTAKAPTTAYFLHKRLVKYRVPVAIACGVLALLVGMAVWSYSRVAGERNRALMAEAESMQQRDVARTAEKQSGQRLIHACVEQGWRLYEDGDLGGALLWEVEALRLLHDSSRLPGYDRDAEMEQRIRVAQILCRMPTIRTIMDKWAQVVFSPSGERMAVVPLRRDNPVESTVEVWDVHGERPLVTAGIKADLRGSSFILDSCRMLTLSADRTARIWDVVTGRLVSQILLHSDSVDYCQFSPDGKRVMAASKDKIARTWDSETGEPVGPSLLLDGAVYVAAFSPDGERLVTASQDGKARVWDVRTGQSTTPPLKCQRSPQIAFSSDGKRIIVCSIGYGSADSVQIWDSQTGRAITGPVGTGHLGGLCNGLDSFIRQSVAREIINQYHGLLREGKLSEDEPGKKIDENFRATYHATLQEFAQSGFKFLGVVTNGYRLAGVSFFGTAHVWDAESGKQLMPALKLATPVYQAELSRDGKRLVTICGDKTVRVWDAETGQSIAPPMSSRDEVHAFFPDPDIRRLITTTRSSIQVWDAVTGTPVTPPLYQGATVLWPPSANATCRHFSVLCGERRAMMAALDLLPKEVSRPSRGNLLEALGDAFMDAIGESLRNLPSHSVTTGDPTPVTYVWDTDLVPHCTVLGSTEAGAGYAGFSQDGERLLVIGRDNVARVWDVRTGYPVTPPLAHQGLVIYSVFSPSGTRVASVVAMANADLTIYIWDVSSGQLIVKPFPSGLLRKSEWPNPDEPILARLIPNQLMCCGAFSPDDKQFVMGLGRSLHGWDLTGDRPLLYDAGRTIEPYLYVSSFVSHIAFGGNGGRLVISTNPSRALVMLLNPRVVAFSDDGSHPRDDRYGVGPGFAALEHGDQVNCAWVSPDNQRVVTACRDGTAQVWNAETFSPVAPPMRHHSNVAYASFSPDGMLVFTASADGTARVWDAGTGRPVVSPLEHQAEVVHGAFSPDGKRVVTASWDKTSRVWSVQTGQAVSPPLAHGSAVRYAAFTSDGERVVTVDAENIARVWSLSPDNRPVQELVLLARLLSGRKVDPSGSAALLGLDEVRGIWQRLQGKYRDLRIAQ